MMNWEFGFMVELMAELMAEPLAGLPVFCPAIQGAAPQPALGSGFFPFFLTFSPFEQ